MNEIIADFSLKRQGITVFFTLISMGTDYVVLISGGDVSHVGAVTASDHKDCFTKAFDGHKEGIITQLVQKKLAGFCPYRLCVIGGIYVEQITKEQIESVIHICEDGAERLAEIITGKNQR